jgi:hypothetical protein
MKIDWWIPGSPSLLKGAGRYDKVSASVWIRCFQLLPELEALGIDTRVNPLAGGTPDAAVFSRRWSKRDLARAEALKKRGCWIILDTPVNYFSDADLPPFRGTAKRDFMAFAETADLITCPSKHIAVSGGERGFRVETLEDSIDSALFAPRSPAETAAALENPVFGWAGVASKARELNILAEAIEWNGWRFKIISNEPPELDFPYEFVKWRHASFSAEIAECAVGVFPRDFDNDYDRGHSFFKIGVFLSRHVPVVCSPVPSYAEIATPRNSRIVPALDPKAWGTALASLLDSSWTPDFSENPVERFTPRRIAEKLKTLLETMR